MCLQCVINAARPRKTIGTVDAATVERLSQYTKDIQLARLDVDQEILNASRRAILENLSEEAREEENERIQALEDANEEKFNVQHAEIWAAIGAQIGMTYEEVMRGDINVDQETGEVEALIHEDEEDEEDEEDDEQEDTEAPVDELAARRAGKEPRTDA